MKWILFTFVFPKTGFSSALRGEFNSTAIVLTVKWSCAPRSITILAIFWVTMVMLSLIWQIFCRHFIGFLVFVSHWASKLFQLNVCIERLEKNITGRQNYRFTFSECILFSHPSLRIQHATFKKWFFSLP